MKNKLMFSFVGGALLSSGTLYLAFKNVPFTELLQYLASINYSWLIPAVAVSVFSFLLRTVRWRIILEPTRRIGFWRAFHPMMIGFMINCVLPGRLGEVARPLILQQKENIPFATGLATIVTERVFDVSLLILLFMATAGALQTGPEQNIAFGSYQLNQQTVQAVFNTMLKLGALLIAGVAIFCSAKARELIYRVILYLPSLFFFAGHRFKESFKKRICEPGVNMLKNLAQGFSLVKYPIKILSCMILSVLIWGAQALSYYLFSLGSPGIGLTYFEMITVMVIICFVISLPSVPGWWGLWEAGGVFALSLFGVSAKDAAGFTLANHAIQVFPVILIGMVSAVIFSVNIRRMSFTSRQYLHRGNLN